MDSLDVVELVMEFEQRFELDLPNADATSFRTVGDLWLFLIRRRTGSEPAAHPPTASDPTWREVVRFIAEQTGTPPDDVQWDSLLYPD